MNLDVFDIENFNILSDDENYYFFRALNMGDNADIENGITLDENGNISRIRTDRERYEGESLYSSTDSLSLKEMFDHIKMHHRKDTNCISLSTNANVAALYGRGYYKDKYVMIKVPKKELGEKVYNAGKYMASEILKRIDGYLNNGKVDDLTRYYLDAIDNAKTPEQLKEIMDKFHKKDEQEENIFFEKGIEYDYTDINSVEYRALSSSQNFEKDKIVAKLNVLNKNIIPNVSNKFLVQTLGNAFSSLEFINYNDIETSSILEVPNTIIDLLSLIQQVDENYPLVKELKQEIIRMINEKDYSLFSYAYTNRTLDIDNEYTIENMFNLTNGYLDFESAFNMYKKSFYLAKSKLRTLSTLEVLDQKLDSKYKDLILYLKDNTYGVEPKVFSRRVGTKMQVSESVTLDISNSEREMFDFIDKLSVENLTSIVNNPKEFFSYCLLNFSSLHFEHQDKETYYANAIIDLFDWSKLNVVKFSDRQRQQIIDKLKQCDIVRIYNVLKNNGVREKDIANTLLTTVIKDKSLDEIDINDTFTVEQLEDYLDYYKINGTKELKLRSYQASALTNIDKIFETRNFATAVLPTGAGKSFVALAEMLEHSEEDILYLAPSDEIINQIRKYIVNIICDESLTISEQEKIKTKFKRLKLCTYAKLMSDKKNGFLNDITDDFLHSKYGLIVFDELHRTGASEWKNGVLELLSYQDNNTKVLGITATPLRDADNVDMSSEWAEYFGYSDEEIIKGKHLAINMDLEEAISLGYVVNPKIVQCEYNLEKDGSLERLREKIELIDNEEIRQRELAKFEMLRRRVLEADGIEKVIGDNIKTGGKYIVFCPVVDNQGKRIESIDGYSEESKVTGKEAIYKYQKELIRHLLKYNGVTDVELTEETSIEKYIEIAKKYGYEFNSMLAEYGKSINGRELDKFSVDEPGKIKFMTVMDKLNEGVHLDKIDGIIWLRPLDENSRILYLQQLGRCIYSIDPNRKVKDEERPIVIDITNNRFRIKGGKEKRTRINDLDELRNIYNWIKQHGGKVPDINSDDVVEFIYAKTLKRIQAKYEQYNDDINLLDGLSKYRRYQIEEILSIAAELNLWEIDFREIGDLLIERPGKEDFKYDNFEINGILSDYYEIEESVNNYNNLEHNAIKWVKRIQEYCEKYQQWPRSNENTKRTNDGTTSSMLYAWFTADWGYKKVESESNIEINGVSIKKILDDLREKYDNNYNVEIKWVKRIQEYCEKYQQWPSGDDKMKKTSDGTTSSSLYQWLFRCGYISKKFKYSDIEIDGVSIKKILDDLRKKYYNNNNVVIEIVKKIQEYCEKYQKWPSGREKIKKTSDGTTSSSLYHWLLNSKYISGTFEYSDIEINDVSIKKILDDLREKYDNSYNPIIKMIKKIQEYCEKYQEWPSGDDKLKKTSDGTTSSSLYEWLKGTSGYISGKFKYGDIEINDVSIKKILDDLREKYDKRYNVIIKWVKKIQEYCDKYQEWPRCLETMKKTSDGTTSSRLYAWLTADWGYKKVESESNIEINGVSIKKILDDLREKYDNNYNVEIKWVKKIQEYCKKYQEWPSDREKGKRTSDGTLSSSLCNWLTRSGYRNGNFEYSNIEIESISIKEILDNLYNIYGNDTKSKKIYEEKKNFNLKYASKSEDLVVRIYPMLVKLESIYSENNMEEFTLLFNEVLEHIDSNGLKVEPSSLIRLTILPDDQKLEFCMKEYMNNSIQNNVDEASLYKALYNYYSVLEKGNNQFNRSNL